MRLFIFLGRSLIAAFFIMGALQTLKEPLPVYRLLNQYGLSAEYAEFATNALAVVQIICAVGLISSVMASVFGFLLFLQHLAVVVASKPDIYSTSGQIALSKELAIMGGLLVYIGYRSLYSNQKRKLD
jgi:uncharacterized membrane protein YphA (DoxX/SURF4 family)